jgi:hypothetical protein
MHEIPLPSLSTALENYVLHFIVARYVRKRKFNLCGKHIQISIELLEVRKVIQQ